MARRLYIQDFHERVAHRPDRRASVSSKSQMTAFVKSESPPEELAVHPRCHRTTCNQYDLQSNGIPVTMPR
jgi:hypothetical protein